MDFVAKKVDKLEKIISRLGLETVIGFVYEPIVGTTLGQVPYVPRYLAAIKRVYVKYSVLFILDEVICGIGRTGTIYIQ